MSPFAAISPPNMNAVAIVAGVYIFYRLAAYIRDDVRKLNGPPRSIASFLFGHEFMIWNGLAGEWHLKWANDFGSFIKIKAAFWHPDIILASDHAAVRHIVSDTITYVKSPFQRPLIGNLLGRGLVWAEGEEHAFQRRLFAPAFTTEAIKNMADPIAESVDLLKNKLDNLVLSNGGEAVVNICSFLSLTTLDIFGRVGFDFDFKLGETPEAQGITDSWHDITSSVMLFSSFVAGLVVRAMPWIAHLPIPALQVQSGVRVITRKLSEKLFERERSMLEMQVPLEKSTGRSGKNIFDLLVSANAKEKSGGLSKQQVIDNMNTFVMVGYETTAAVLTFAVFELTRNTGIQQKLREEILTHGLDLSYDGIAKMKYLDAVLKESLRLHPAVFTSERVAVKDDVIPLSEPIKQQNGKVLTSVRVKKGQVIHINYAGLQIRKATWGPDAEVFRPERWLDGSLPSQDKLPHGWNNLMAFLDGPRNCIGWRLAVFEFKAIIATLIRSFEFHKTDTVVEARMLMTLQPVADGKDGVLPVKVTMVQH